MHVVGLVTVAVLAYAPPGGAGAGRLVEARQALERALRASGVDVVDAPVQAALAAHSAGVTDERNLAFFGQARARVEEGRRALERVELGPARARFAEAADLLRPELVRPGVSTLLADVMLLEGIAAYEERDHAQAEAAFRRAVALEPAAELTEATVRPELVRAFRAATAPRRAAGVLEVVSNGDEITVDGRASGPTATVPAGPHLLRLQGKGLAPAAALVEVPDGGKARLEQTLATDAVPAELAQLEARPTRGGMARLVATLGLDGLLVAAAGVGASGRLTMVATRVEHDGCATATLVRPVPPGEPVVRVATTLVGRLRELRCGDGDPTAVMDVVLGALTSSTEELPRPVDRTPPARPRRRVIESPWLWAGVLAASGLAVGLGVGLAPHGTSYAVTVDGGRFSR